MKANSRRELTARPGLASGRAVADAYPLYHKYIVDKMESDRVWLSPIWVYIRQCELFLKGLSYHVGAFLAIIDEQEVSCDRDCGGWGHMANIMNLTFVADSIAACPQYAEVVPWMLYYLQVVDLDRDDSETFGATLATRRRFELAVALLNEEGNWLQDPESQKSERYYFAHTHDGQLASHGVPWMIRAGQSHQVLGLIPERICREVPLEADHYIPALV